MKYNIQCYELYEPGSLLRETVAPYEEPGQIIKGYVIYFLKVCSNTKLWKLGKQVHVVHKLNLTNSDCKSKIIF
jgi:hypothetical protein